MYRTSGLLLTTLCLLGLVEPVAPAPAPDSPPPQAAWRKARVGGKYEMLLRQLRVPADVERYGDFRDHGQREIKEYANFTGLPPGHWVYVYPYWYIWRDLAGQPRPRPPFSASQVTGPPDTPGAGDIPTAWASATPDGDDEWLLLEYPELVMPAAVLVHETFNPGALVRVTAFRLDGEEVEIWKGKDPLAPGSGRGVAEVVVRPPFKTNRIRIHLDSKNVPGWNEIDAVGLRDGSGKVQWASGVEASSTFGQNQFAPGVRGIAVFPGFAPQAVPAVVPPPAPAPAADLRKLEKEVQDLKREVKELKDAVKELTEALKKKP